MTIRSSIDSSSIHADDRDGVVSKKMVWCSFQGLVRIRTCRSGPATKSCLCGPSVSCKSTLIRCLNHLESYSAA